MLGVTVSEKQMLYIHYSFQILEDVQQSSGTESNLFQHNRPISQIPQRICAISHNAAFCNRNVHMCAHFCYKMLHCGISVWCILGFVRWDYYTSTMAIVAMAMAPWPDHQQP